MIMKLSMHGSHVLRPMMRCGLVLTMWIGLAIIGFAQPPNSHPTIRAYLGEEAAIVGWLETTKLDLGALEGSLNLPSMDVPKEILATLRSNKVQRVYVVGSTSALLGNQSGWAVLVPCDRPTELVQALRKNPNMSAWSFREEPGIALLAPTSIALDAMRHVHGAPSPNLLSAIESCKGSIGIAIAWPRSFLDFAAKLLPEGQSNDEWALLRRAMQGLEWLSASGNLPPGEITVRSQFSSADIATSLLQETNAILSRNTFPSLPIKIEGNSASATFSTKTPLIEKLLAQAKDQAESEVAMNRMRQLGLALHNYESDHLAFPPQSLSSDGGQALLSWRVLLLPYVDQQALYEQFHLDEAWDSPHNLPLVSKIPELYRGDSNLPAGNTRLVAPLTANSLMGRPGAPVGFREIVDGTSTTLWLVESTSERSVPWTKPDDLVIDPKNPLEGIRSSDSGRMMVGFLDGSVRSISSKLKPELIIAIFSINGGEVVESHQLD